jgi:DNA polymerase-4
MADAWTEPILHVDMDAFFVEVERLRKPELVGIPVAVGGTGDRSVVAAASYEARAFGVHSALPMSRARRLCRDLTVIPPDHAEYGKVSERVFDVFRSFTPLVEGLSVDEAFLDVSGLRLHYSDPVAIGQAIRHVLGSEVGLPASVGIAASKFVAKLASEAAKPEGLLHIPVVRQAEFLEALPVRSLWGVGQATLASLNSLGVETVVDLLSVPRRKLESALGHALAIHLIDLARGDDPRPVTPDTEAKSVSSEETFERDLSTDGEVNQALRSLADGVGHRLRRAGLVGRTIVLKMRFADFTTVTRSETLGFVTDVDIEIFHAAQRLVARTGRAGRPIRLLGIGVSSLSERDTPVQLSVDGDPRWRNLDTAMDAVRERFGRDAVGPASAPRPHGRESDD